ncbi:MAG: metal ABC transporter permease [Anaerolineae bacterium]|jgi:manganese/zinc/iron transport system permease protein|nr:metal ABC transporter permease [Anaerolineae bacterium]
MSAEDRRTWAFIALMLLVALLFVPVSQALPGVTYDYTLTVVALGGAALGVFSGVLGCFALLRQESLLGDVLSHAALPGVAIAFLLAGRHMPSLLIGAGISAWLGTQFIAALTATTRLKPDAAMGVVLTSWFALGLVLLSYIQNRPDASQAGLEKFIFGQAAAMVQSDVELIVLAALLCFALLLLLWKEFQLITFDAAFARAAGYPVRGLNMLLSTMLVVVIVLGLQLAGVILMVGLLIAPGLAARQWTRSLSQMLLLAAIFGALAGSSGAVISATQAALPTGPLIIVMAALIVLLSLALAPERGWLWRWYKRRQDRARFQTIPFGGDAPPPPPA